MLILMKSYKSHDREKHHRRSIRLKGYNYSQPGAYFVTICTHGRECLFGEVVDGRMRLNALGKIARQCWLEIPRHFPHAALDAFVVMPNHVHGIIWIVESQNDDSVGATDVIVGARHEMVVGRRMRRPYEKMPQMQIPTHHGGQNGNPSALLLVRTNPPSPNGSMNVVIPLAQPSGNAIITNM